MTVEEFDHSKLVLPDGTFYATDCGKGDWRVGDIVTAERLVSDDQITFEVIPRIKLLRKASWAEYVRYLKQIGWPLDVGKKKLTETVWVATTD